MKIEKQKTTFPAHLIEGYKAYQEGRLEQDKGTLARLAEHGQTPKVMMISCCDSRSMPEVIFNTDPGEIFVVRNVANLVPAHGSGDVCTATASAMEFAVNALKVQHIVVMGHARCGGIAASLAQDLQPLSDDNFIGQWIKRLKPSAAALSADFKGNDAERQLSMEQASIYQSVENLSSYPWLKSKVEEGALAFHGAWYDIANGALWTMQADGSFERV